MHPNVCNIVRISPKKIMKLLGGKNPDQIVLLRAQAAEACSNNYLGIRENDFPLLRRRPRFSGF